MNVICISGPAQIGKDTSAEMLKNALEDRGDRAVVVHYADMLKFICKTFFDWNGKKDKYGRALLQYVGTEIFRARDENYWVKLMLSVLHAVADANMWDYVIIADCRFPNEIYFVKTEFDAVHVRIANPNFVSPLTPEQQQHPSETSLNGYPADYTLENGGTLSDLENAVANLVKEL